MKSPGSLCNVSVQDLQRKYLARSLYKISIRGLLARLLKRSLYKKSTEDLCEGSQSRISVLRYSMQDLDRCSLHQVRSLYKISKRRLLARSLYKISTRALLAKSVGGFLARSLIKISMRGFLARSLCKLPIRGLLAVERRMDMPRSTFYGKMQDANTATPVSCEPARSKCT